jgi:hypothetical protein
MLRKRSVCPKDQQLAYFFALHNMTAAECWLLQQ